MRTGDVYKGGFNAGKMHGEGAYHFAAATCAFVGAFENGEFARGRWVLGDGSSTRAAAFKRAPGRERVFVPTGPATRYYQRPGLQQEGTFAASGQWCGGTVTAA